MTDYLYKTANPLLYELLRDFAKKNRKHPTEAESVLWSFLRGSKIGLPFRRQHIIGDYIADFACLSPKLVIEIDGLYHSLPEMQISDKERTEWLNEHGYKVIRFTNEEVLHCTDNVINVIKENLDSYGKNEQ